MLRAGDKIRIGSETWRVLYVNFSRAHCVSERREVVTLKDGEQVRTFTAASQKTLDISPDSAVEVIGYEAPPVVEVTAPKPKHTPTLAPVTPPSRPQAKPVTTGSYVLQCGNGFLRRIQPAKPGDTAHYKVVTRDKATVYARRSQAELKVAEAAALGFTAEIV